MIACRDNRRTAGQLPTAQARSTTVMQNLQRLVLVDRAQTAGPGNLTIPTEKIFELGNYESVATIRDVPDLAFSLESLDVSAEIECMLLGIDFAGAAAGTELKLANVLPLDIASLFKAGRTSTNPFDVAASVAIPYLVLEASSRNDVAARPRHVRPESPRDA